MKRLWLFVALLAASPALADSSLPPAHWANRQLPDARQEAAAQALMEDMRDLVRRRIAAGESPASIRAWLIQRYGNWITYRPPSEPLTWPLWLLPVALLAGGALLARSRLKRRGRG